MGAGTYMHHEAFPAVGAASLRSRPGAEGGLLQCRLLPKLCGGSIGRLSGIGAVAACGKISGCRA